MDRKLLSIIFKTKIIIISYFLLSLLDIVFINLYPQNLSIKTSNTILFKIIFIAIYLTPLFIILMVYFSMLKRYIYKKYTNKNPLMDDKTALKQVIKYAIFWNIVSDIILILNLVCLILIYSKNPLFLSMAFFISLILLLITIILIYMTTYGSVIAGLEYIKPYQVNSFLNNSSKNVWIVSFIYYFSMFFFITKKSSPILEFIVMFLVNILCAYVYVKEYIKIKDQCS